MSTTAEKLQQIKSIKNDLKEKINAKGGSITDTTPFAEYPTIADELMGGGSSGGEGEVRSIKLYLDMKQSCEDMFHSLNLTELPEGLLEYDDTENVTSMLRMFHSCSNLISVPKLNMSKVTAPGGMFYGCKSLKTIPSLDTSKSTNTSSMFYGCEIITSIPQIDTSKAMYTNNMFQNCKKLISIPKLDTKTATNMSSMFSMCYELTTIPELDIRNVTTISNIFDNCKKIQNLTILNIKVNLQIASGTSWGHLLTLDSLLNTIKELIDTGSSKTLTMGSTNLNKIANVYVKLTGEPEEDETLPKLPFVVCESTDEGAMLITDYVTLKNWALA